MKVGPQSPLHTRGRVRAVGGDAQQLQQLQGLGARGGAHVRSQARKRGGGTGGGGEALPTKNIIGTYFKTKFPAFFLPVNFQVLKVGRVRRVKKKNTNTFGVFRHTRGTTWRNDRDKTDYKC